MATAKKAAKPAAKKPAASKAKAAEPAAPVVNVEKTGTAREESVPVPKGVADVKEFTVEVVDNAHAVLTINGTKVRLGQADVSDARKLLDAAFIELH